MAAVGRRITPPPHLHRINTPNHSRPLIHTRKTLTSMRICLHTSKQRPHHTVCQVSWVMDSQVDLEMGMVLHRAPRHRINMDLQVAQVMAQIDMAVTDTAVEVVMAQTDTMGVLQRHLEDRVGMGA